MASRLGKAVRSSCIRAPLLGLLCTLSAMSAPVLLSPANASALALQKVGRFDAPTYVTSDPGDPNRLFIVERPGRIRLTEGGSTTTFLDIESIVSGGDGEQGLFSMAFSPDYATNHHFYVAYSGVDDPSTTGDESGDFHLDEFTSQGDSANPGSRRGVLTIEHSQTPNHYGGQLQFGPDDYLYASTGDGADEGDPPGNAQNLQTLYGKILRIDPEGASGRDYTIPASNPFVGTAGADEVWSYGLRNPWRFSFDRLTAALTIGDVGGQSWEEVNYEPVSAGGGRGDNFGWDCREGAHDHTGPEAPGDGSPSPVCPSRVGTFTEPVFEYQHTDEPRRCSIIGGYVVRDLGLGDLYGRYLYMDLCVGKLRSLNLGLPRASDDRSEGVSVAPVASEGDELPDDARATSFGEDADGRIYVASLHGPVYRLTDASNDFSFGKVKKNKKKGTAKLTVKVPGPGELDLAKTRKVKADEEAVEEAGNEKLPIKPKGKAKKKLNNSGKAKVKAEVTYTPEGGEPNEKSKRIRLKKRH
jgi:glucose/arabinose dehydrogenase